MDLSSMAPFSHLSWIPVLLLITSGIPGHTIAQISQGGQPPSFQNNNLSTNLQRTALPTHQLPSIDNEQMRQTAESQRQEECRECEKQYWGKGIDVNIDLTEVARTTPYQNGVVGMFKIASPTAKGLQLYFDQFNLPDGGKLFVYNEERDQLLGAFTAQNNRDDNHLALQPLPSNPIIVEYYLPEGTEAQLQIGKVVHDFQGILDNSGPWGNSGNCNTNANCLTPHKYEKPISSTGLILAYSCTGGLFAICSGALLNNTAQDGTPYFLTANHCMDDCSGSTHEGPSTWVFLFNHETPQCQDKDNRAYRGQSISGSTILASGSSSDFGLLELDNTPPASYNICYAGWSRKEQLPDHVIGFHHPSGDVKKGNFEPSPYPYFITASGFNFGANYWMAIWPQIDGEGVTEGGSSGSPLFDHKQRVIGQLYGGDDNDCFLLPDTSGYGKFSVSWNQGNLGQWLDPLNTGDSTLRAYCPYSTCDKLVRLTDTSGIFSDGSVDNSYTHSANCRWMINVPGNNPVKLSFLDFDLEKDGQDSIYIYDGDFETAPLLGQFTSFVRPSPVQSTGDTLSVQFVSDTGGRAATGWEAHYCMMPQLTAFSNKDTVCSWYKESTQLHAKGGTHVRWEPSRWLSCTNCRDPIATPEQTTTYRVIEKYGYNCHDTSRVTVNVKRCKPPADTLGLGEVFITPNPSPGQFEVSFSAVEQMNIELNLYGMGGRQILLDELADYKGAYRKTFHLQNDYNGQFVLQIKTDHGTLNKKLIIQNG